MLAEILEKCKALAHLDLNSSGIAAEGIKTRRLAKVLGELRCKVLTHLHLISDRIGAYRGNGEADESAWRMQGAGSSGLAG